MWLFWYFTCTAVWIGLVAALVHGLSLPFCRGGASFYFQHTVVDIAKLISNFTERGPQLWNFIRLTLSDFCGIDSWNGILLFDFWGSRSKFFGGKPGPKSGWRWRRFNSPAWWRLLSVVLIASARGEGCGRPMASAGVPLQQWAHDFIDSGTKQHGTRPVTSLAPLSWTPTDNFVEKRSMKRAYTRACRDGVSWYQGRAYTPDDFPVHLRQTQLPDKSQAALKSSGRKDLHQYNQRQCSKRRLQILSWNVGGLSQARLDEIRTWASEQHIGIITLLETRWPWSSEWEDSSFLYIHSGVPGDRSCGILLMIAKWLCPSCSVRWKESIPGRLLHLQLRLQPRSMDFVACYQYCYNNQPNRLKDRKRWWEHFLQLVGTCLRDMSWQLQGTSTAHFLLQAHM